MYVLSISLEEISTRKGIIFYTTFCMTQMGCCIWDGPTGNASCECTYVCMRRVGCFHCGLIAPGLAWIWVLRTLITRGFCRHEIIIIVLLCCLMALCKKRICGEFPLNVGMTVIQGLYKVTRLPADMSLKCKFGRLRVVIKRGNLWKNYFMIF